MSSYQEPATLQFVHVLKHKGPFPSHTHRLIFYHLSKNYWGSRESFFIYFFLNLFFLFFTEVKDKTFSQKSTSSVAGAGFSSTTQLESGNLTQIPFFYFIILGFSINSDELYFFSILFFSFFFLCVIHEASIPQKAKKKNKVNTNYVVHKRHLPLSLYPIVAKRGRKKKKNKNGEKKKKKK